jgi:cytochrome c peroxidase
LNWIDELATNPPPLLPIAPTKLAWHTFAGCGDCGDFSSFQLLDCPVSPSYFCPSAFNKLFLRDHAEPCRCIFVFLRLPKIRPMPDSASLDIDSTIPASEKLSPPIATGEQAVDDEASLPTDSAHASGASERLREEQENWDEDVASPVDVVSPYADTIAIQDDVSSVEAETTDAQPAQETIAPHPGGGAVGKCLSRLAPAMSLLRQHTVLASACSVCLGVGSLLGIWLRPSQPLEVQAIVEPASAPTIQLTSASTARRHEPIQPLLPFVELNPAIVELGKRLFHEPALSINGRTSCSTCHPLHQGGTTSVPLPHGVNGQPHRYNAPTVLNAALNCAQLWDGSVATLEEQVEGPITNSHELGSSWERVTKFLKHDPYYSRSFTQLMEGEPSPEHVRTALATFLRSLITLNSKFDQWLAGTEEALNSDEFGGYYLFKKFDCIRCHQGPGAGGTMFQPLGIAKAYFDQNASQTDLGRYQFTKLERDRHVFRVPQLRNVELTAPYLHNGSVATLEEAVALMIEYQCGQEVNQEDVRRITAFLKTLTGELPAESRSLRD